MTTTTNFNDKVRKVKEKIQEANLLSSLTREEYAYKLLGIVDQLIKEKVLNKTIESDKKLLSELEGRATNMYLRGYDIPLQGNTTYTCEHMKPIMPEPYFFDRKSFLHKF